MRDNATFSNFIMSGDFSEKKINKIKEYYDLNEKQLVKKTFKFLNAKIDAIQNKRYFEVAIQNAIYFLWIICGKIEFDEEEVQINKKRIKKSRETLLTYANKYKNPFFLAAANKLDEIVLDKNINLDVLKELLIKLIDKKEDINIIKKLLNTNKGVLLLNNNILFNYTFELALNSIIENNFDIYYYISLLKIFYTSNINKQNYLKRLNAVSNDKNEFANEIYMILFGVKRGLSPKEILKKYKIITDFSTPYVHVPNDSYYDEFIITIDGSKTKLRDDAISVRKDGNNYIVGIHIADPSTIIKPDSREDLIAQNNYKCVYTQNGCVRLLSSELESKLTLDETKYRNVISMYVTIDSNGDVIDYYITENVIKISCNLSYNEGNELFYNYNGNLSSTLKNLYEVCLLLENKNPVKKVYWQKKDNDLKDINKSDLIIVELMVLYNRLIATITSDQALPYIYRIQDPSYIQSLVKKMGINIDDNTQKIIDDIYMDSKYSTTPRYHNGLHLPIYSHSTDTLRRYPDMYNLYLLHTFYFKDMNMPFDNDEFDNLVAYFNQRNVELSLMKSEYERALKLTKKN